ncbi:lipopolysaccharide biosynthesis protein [Streptosporangium carneum]|uniref:Polysaccharide biosynthesis protein n=1 Tax=Streptosporangium carneum TaxID=47481 RepID=A0A9W6ICS8_9ACTN|nr:hypothetical protein [Streptosporangium carneum]GLK15323.1 hypothetical protein GCM10017600_87360 [Streptosporangium carneum]
MTRVLERVLPRMRPPGGRHLRTFTSLTTAGLSEAILPSLTLIALVRSAGAERSGQVIFAQALASIWFLLCDPRPEDAAQRFVPIEQRRSGRGSALFLRLLRWDVAIGVAATGVGLLLAAAAHLLGLATGEFALMLSVAIVTRGAMASHGASGAGFALADRLRDLGLLRMGCAVLSAGLAMGGLFAGGPLAYLAGQALGALVMAVTLYTRAKRMVLTEFGPASARVSFPSGLVGFSVKASVGTFVAGISDSGILAVAAVLGGPSLVTILKIATAPGRMYANLVIPVAAMLYPRLAQAAVTEDGRTLIRRDLVRASLLLAVVGAACLTVALPTVNDVLGMMYGEQYAEVGTVAALILAAECVRGLFCWSNVLPLAVGRPSWRLAYLSAEGLLLLGALFAADLVAPDAFGTSFSYACGTLAVAVVGVAVWATLLRRIVNGRG